MNAPVNMCKNLEPTILALKRPPLNDQLSVY